MTRTRLKKEPPGAGGPSPDRREKAETCDRRYDVRKSSSIAITDRERAPINLVAADIWFDDPDLAGLAVVRVVQKIARL
jgi:hypothetical protein